MWVILALGASFFWGLTYVLDEKIYEKISVTTSLATGSFFAFFALLLISYLTGNLKPDLHEIATSKNTLMLVLAGTVTLVVAELLIGFSITAKNATLAGLIEISYPIFIALAAYFLFKENQITASTIVGGILVFAGVAVIYLFNK
jgi:drug/metabolite transporter (DMT)-like permease